MFHSQVFSTLSFSGSALFSKWNRSFDVVIIDEAAQAVSPVIFSSSFVFLMPLMFQIITRYFTCGAIIQTRASDAGVRSGPSISVGPSMGSMSAP